MTGVFLVSAARTAIGSFGGSLKDQKPGELGALVAKAAIERAGISADVVEAFVLGNVIHTEPRDAYAARIASMGAGIPKEAPALTVNRLCGSGLQAIISAAQSILLGDVEIAIGASAEIMSRAPYFVLGARWGLKMGEWTLQDGLTGALTDPFQAIHMGVTAENVAAEAFAPQACAVSCELGFDPAKVNPNGSGISLGHPIGATGAIITTKLAYELHRTGGRYGLVTMCIGGGQGIAAIWERV